MRGILTHSFSLFIYIKSRSFTCHVCFSETHSVSRSIMLSKFQSTCLILSRKLNVLTPLFGFILSRVGYLTRLMTPLCQQCSGYLLCFLYTLMHFTITHFTVILLVLCVLLCWLTSSVGESIQLSSMAARLRLTSTATIQRLTWRMCYLHIYLRPLLLNEPFVVTVDTSVRVIIELLLLAMQPSIVAFPWKYLF
jgi:hypothetical protein